jgi:hypothetical protein
MAVTGSIESDGGNAAAIRTLVSLVAAAEGRPAEPPRLGPVAANYYSFTFRLEWAGGPSVFVKVPKEDMRGGEKRIFPLSAGDRQLGREEAASLGRLNQVWPADDLGVQWVRLRHFLPDANAIVTERVVADEALEVFRRLDQRRRLGAGEDRRRLAAMMARLGGALGRYHRAQAVPGAFGVAHFRSKLAAYRSRLGSIPQPAGPALDRKLAELPAADLPGLFVPTLKGIDLRNVLVGPGDRLFLLDPGRTKPALREADVARFLLTYRVLYWGSRRLFLLREPDPEAETAFLRSYYREAGSFSPELLAAQLLKEQLKHWVTALDSLRRRGWPTGLVRLAVALYVTPFYSSQIRRPAFRPHIVTPP